MQRGDESNFVFELFNGNPTVRKLSFNGKEFTSASLPQGRRKRGAGGGLSPPPNNFYLYKAEENTQTRNSDLLKKMKEPRLALSTVLAHMLQAISDSLFSSISINSFPNF